MCAVLLASATRGTPGINLGECPEWHIFMFCSHPNWPLSRSRSSEWGSINDCFVTTLWMTLRRRTRTRVTAESWPGLGSGGQWAVIWGEGLTRSLIGHWQANYPGSELTWAMAGDTGGWELTNWRDRQQLPRSPGWHCWLKTRYWWLSNFIRASKLNLMLWPHRYGNSATSELLIRKFCDKCPDWVWDWWYH